MGGGRGCGEDTGHGEGRGGERGGVVIVSRTGWVIVELSPRLGMGVACTWVWHVGLRVGRGFGVRVFPVIGEQSVGRLVGYFIGLVDAVISSG